MKKKIPGILVIVGVVLMVLSYIIPVVVFIVRSSAGFGIIGGAGWPTFWFLYQVYGSDIGFWGAVLAVAGLIWMIIRRVKACTAQ